MPEKVKSGFTPENILYTPEDIVYFISKLAAKWKPKRILDPLVEVVVSFQKYLH